MSHRSLGCAFLALGLAVQPHAASAQVPVLSPQGALAAGVPAPSRVAVAPGGRLHVVNAKGELFMLTPRGDLMARLKLPERGIAVAASATEVFVSTVAGSILRISPVSGKVVGSIAAGGSPGPNGLAFDEAKGLLWMAERNTGRLRALRLSGTTAYEIQSAGGQAIRFPGDVAVDQASGLVWLLLEANEGAPMAFAYSLADGSFVRAAFQNGAAAGQLNRGGGIAAASGFVFGVDSFAGKVQVVDAAGAFAAQAGAFGTAQGQLRLPSGAAFMANGDLVVANTDNGRLERFGSGAPLPVCPGDSDCDGLPDAWELAHGLNPNDPSDAMQDADFDGLTALEELTLGTDPGKRDTDGDGVSDGDEVAAGTDPLKGAAAAALTISAPASQGPGLVRISSTVQGGVGCTAAWSQVGGPEVKLRGAATFTPSFVARTAATYKLRGVATCAGVAGLPAEVEIAVVNVAPRADCGRVQVARVGEPVRLDGRFSSDANGDALSLSWEQVLGPAAILRRAEYGKVVVAREPGLLGFQLTAVDAAAAGGTAEAAVVVLGRRERAAVAAAVTPVAGRVGEAVALDARDSFTDGRRASFRWTQAVGPQVALAQADSARPSFVPAAAGRYAFDVQVMGRGRLSPAARVEVFVAAAGGELPMAVAKAAGAAALGEPLTLDGSASTGSGLGFRWRQVAGPAAGLTEADQAVATVVPFTPGAYRFELTAAAGEVESAPAAVAFTVAPSKGALPVAVAKAGKAHGHEGHRKGGRVVLDGRASTGARHFRWTQVAGPWVALEDAGTATPWFEARAAARYGFELEVDDGAVRSAPARIEVGVRSAKGGDRDDDEDDDDHGERE